MGREVVLSKVGLSGETRDGSSIVYAVNEVSPKTAAPDHRVANLSSPDQITEAFDQFHLLQAYGP